MQSNIAADKDRLTLNADGTSNLMTIILTPFGGEAMHIPTLSTRQIICNHSIETVKTGDLYLSIRTPVGLFDLAKALEVLPPEQEPEAIIVWADSTATMLPRNLEHFSNCYRLLMVGDTHHQRRPLQNIMVYAANSPFNAIILMFRQHLHFFREAGFKNSYWIQGQMTFPEIKPIQRERRREIAILGSASDLHPQRRRIIDALEAAGYPIVTGFYAHAKAMDLYSEVQISLNISLNGDMNWRPYEVIGAGGFLITDKISHFSGMDILFREGEHYISFDSLDELKSKLDYYLDHPDECLEIAHRAQAHYLTNLSRDRITRAIWDQLLHNKTLDMFHVDEAERLAAQSSDSTKFLPRVAAYEIVQECHRLQPTVKALFLGNNLALSISDCADLPRLEIFIESNDGKKIDLLEKIARYKSLTYINPQTAQNQVWDIVFAHYPMDAREIANLYNTKTIIINDAPWAVGQQPLADQCPTGFTAYWEGFGIFEKRPFVNLGLFSQHYKELGGEINSLSMSVGIRDKCVLEIGGYVPEALAIEAAAAAHWLILVDEHNRDLVSAPIYNLRELKSLQTIPEYGCFRAAMTDLPEIFHGQFDLVYIHTNTHRMHNLETIIKTAFEALKPAGRIYMTINPLWSACDGHDLPPIVDESGREFSRKDSGIPPWGHLLMTKAELSDHLQKQTDPRTAAKIVEHVYDSPRLNRLFMKDYFAVINQMTFKKGIARALDVKDVPEEIGKRLKEKYSKYDIFDHGGVSYELRK